MDAEERSHESSDVPADDNNINLNGTSAAVTTTTTAASSTRTSTSTNSNTVSTGTTNENVDDTTSPDDETDNNSNKSDDNIVCVSRKKYVDIMNRSMEQVIDGLQSNDPTFVTLRLTDKHLFERPLDFINAVEQNTTVENIFITLKVLEHIRLKVPEQDFTRLHKSFRRLGRGTLKIESKVMRRQFLNVGAFLGLHMKELELRNVVLLNSLYSGIFAKVIELSAHQTLQRVRIVGIRATIDNALDHLFDALSRCRHLEELELKIHIPAGRYCSRDDADGGRKFCNCPSLGKLKLFLQSVSCLKVLKLTNMRFSKEYVDYMFDEKNLPSCIKTLQVIVCCPKVTQFSASNIMTLLKANHIQEMKVRPFDHDDVMKDDITDILRYHNTSYTRGTTPLLKVDFIPNQFWTYLNRLGRRYWTTQHFDDNMKPALWSLILSRGSNHPSYMFYWLTRYPTIYLSSSSSSSFASPHPFLTDSKFATI